MDSTTEKTTTCLLFNVFFLPDVAQRFLSAVVAISVVLIVGVAIAVAVVVLVVNYEC